MWWFRMAQTHNGKKEESSAVKKSIKVFLNHMDTTLDNSISISCQIYKFENMEMKAGNKSMG